MFPYGSGMGQGRLTHIMTHTILTSFSTFSRGKIEKYDLFKEIKNETVAYSVLPKQARYQLRYTRILSLPTADHPSALPTAPSYTGRLLCLPTIADFLLAVQSFSRGKSASLQAVCRREARCIFRYRSTFTLITHLRQGAGCPTAMPGAWASPGHRTANRPLARVISSRGPW